MGTTKKVIYSSRKFVNLPGADDTGSVQAEIAWQTGRYNDEDEEDFSGYMNYTLKFTDCTRSVDFNIEGGTVRERENSIHKVNEMIDVLKGFRNHLEEAFKHEAYMKEQSSKYDEEKRKKLEKELNEQREKEE